MHERINREKGKSKYFVQFLKIFNCIIEVQTTLNMHAFCVPPSPAWYTSPVCSPENGLLYIAGNHTSIAYIPPVKNEDDTTQNNIQIIQTTNQ